MIILDATTKSLEIKLGGAPATNQLPFVASYVDVTTTTYAPGANDGATNSGTAVTAVAAPGASTSRQVKFLTVRNSDTAAVTLTVQYNNNGTTRILWSGALAVGDLWIYTDGEGVRVIDNTGSMKSSGAGGSSSHAVLSSTHSDSVADTVVRGDVIVGNSTPAWARKAKGTIGQLFTMVDGNDPGWATPAGGSGATAQDFIDAVWLKKFFSDASVLPATERIAASLAVFPTEAGVATGSFTRDVGHARFNTAPTTAYWDLGALRSEVLVVANLQLGEGVQIAIAVSSGVPASEYPDGYYFWQDSGGFKIDKRVSGSGTTLGSVPAGLLLGATADSVKQPIGMALYYNDTTGVLKAFVRASSGSWFQVVSTTDSTYTTVRYVSMTWSKAGGGSFTGRVILPFTAWSE